MRGKAIKFQDGLASSALCPHQQPSDAEQVDDSVLLEEYISSLSRICWQDYEHIRFIGQGSFANVRLFRRKSNDSLLVLKEVELDRLPMREKMSALNEGEILLSLDHKNIIRCYGTFVSPQSSSLLVMELEYADGGSLADYLRRATTPIPEYEVLLIFRQIVSGVNYLHSNRVVHRDLKTDNIFLTKSGLIKIGDFNSSKVMAPYSMSIYTMAGTPQYHCPEQCEGKAYNEKCDVWAMGCILYEMMCLRKAFESSDLPILLKKIVKVQLAPIRHSYSSELKDIIYSILQKDSAHRPSAADLLRRVGYLVRNLQLSSRRLLIGTDGPTMDLSTYAAQTLVECDSSLHYPRSVIYQVKLDEQHVRLCKIPFFKSKRIREIKSSETHSLILGDDGSVYSMIPSRMYPISLGLQGKNIKRIAAGSGFSLFLNSSGLVLFSGNITDPSDNGGQEQETSFSSGTQPPKLIANLLNVEVVDVSCATHHVMLVTGEGKALSWGFNGDGRLGIGPNVHFGFHDSVQRVESCKETFFITPFCGQDYSFLLDRDGRVWASGSNKNNKLGLDKRNCFGKISHKISLAAQMTRLSWLKSRIVNISTGSNHVGLLSDHGEAILLGSQDNREEKTISLVSPISRLVCVSNHTLLLTEENCLYFMGWRSFQPQKLTETVSDSQSNYEPIKMGETNASLVETVAKFGMDYPVIQVKDPQLKVDKLADLDTSCHVTPDGQRKMLIANPQCIAALYASPIQLQDGESIAFVGLSSWRDQILLTLDTTIPASLNACSRLSQRKLTDTSGTMENISSLAYESQSCNGIGTAADIGYVDSDDCDDTENTPDWLKNDINEAQMQFATAQPAQVTNNFQEALVKNDLTLAGKMYPKWSSLPVKLDADKRLSPAEWARVEEIKEMIRVLHAGIQEADQVVVEYEKELVQLQCQIRMLQARLDKRHMLKGCSIV